MLDQEQASDEEILGDFERRSFSTMALSFPGPPEVLRDQASSGLVDLGGSLNPEVSVPKNKLQIWDGLRFSIVDLPFLNQADCHGSLDEATAAKSNKQREAEVRQ